MREFIIHNAETIFLVVSLISITAGYLAYRIINRRRVYAAQVEVEKMLATAKREAETIVRAAEVSAKAEALAAREAFEKQTAATRAELNEREKQLIARETSVHEKTQTLARMQEALQELEQKAIARQAELERREAEVETMAQRLGQELQRVSGLTAEEARQQVLQRIEHDAQAEAAAMVRRITREARDNAEREAKRILGIAMQRLAPDCVADATTTTVPLPGEEMKGRIIGRDGRNIRAFEAATGVSVIIDETPQVVMLSGYEPVRREIARLALTQLVADGRIHPARIEEVVKKV
ncbi:MAG: Rnase Y domain-containing protein, partial [Verrucomicrobiae bacterium]|nr:Rnase Y domain-containing protein [Verrucomicrobiae bacterium]